MIKAIIFDMDGVLIDTEALKMDAHRRVLESYGVKLEEKFYLPLIGTTRLNICRKLKARYKLLATPEELALKKVEEYKQIIRRRLEAIPEAVDFLKRLPKKKFRIALCSTQNKAFIKNQLRKLHLLHYFEIITSGEDEVVASKPDPAVYKLTLKKLGLKANECIAIEDSEVGVIAAKKAGIYCIAVPNKYTKHQDFTKADKIVRSLAKVDLRDIAG